jgi:hypothetical protein
MAAQKGPQTESPLDVGEGADAAVAAPEFHGSAVALALDGENGGLVVLAVQVARLDNAAASAQEIESEVHDTRPHRTRDTKQVVTFESGPRKA